MLQLFSEGWPEFQEVESVVVGAEVVQPHSNYHHLVLG